MLSRPDAVSPSHPKRPAGADCDVAPAAWRRAAFERTAEYDSSIARYLEAGLAAARSARFAGADAAAGFAATLRRESAVARGLLSVAHGVAARATRRQGALVQQSARSRRDAAPARARSRADSRSGAARARGDRQAHRALRRRRTRRRAVEAARLALDADRVSAFGGIIALDGTRRSRRRPTCSPKCSSRSWPRRASTTPRSNGCARRRICASSATTRACPQRLARELRVRSALGGVLAEDDDPKMKPESWRVASHASAERRRVARPALRLGHRAPRQEQRHRRSCATR